MLARALERLKARNATPQGRARTLLAAVAASGDSTELQPYLERLGLATPKGWRQRLMARMVAGAISETLEPG